MSGLDANKPDDQLLEEFLAGQGAVRTAYRDTAKPEPPAALDAAILQMSKLPPPVRAPRRRWQTPVAATAVMVLGFGVLMQVQRDPMAQKEVLALPSRMAPAAAPVLQGMAQDKAIKAEAAAPAASETKPNGLEMETRQQPAPAPAKPQPPAPSEKRRAAPAAEPPASPPPPPAAAALADAAPPAAPEAGMAAKSEGYASASALAEAAAGASEAISPQDRPAVAAIAPMAKASRAPAKAGLMARRDELAASADTRTDAAPAAGVEQWASSCLATAAARKAPSQWRGLALAGWTQQLEGHSVKTTLHFAPEASQEAITASLGSLASKATLNSPDCAVPVQRELRQSNGAWVLVCECGSTATE